jgi:hypothetical protein
MSSAPWPPPPDLESIRELVRTADPEGHLAEGSFADEYEPEEEAIFEAIAHLKTAELTAPQILPILEKIWRESFSHDDAAMAAARPGLQSLADQIAHFFGPEARPQTRQSVSA